MNDEFVVAVLVQTFHRSPITADAEHPRSRIAREQNPLRIQWMKLGMDDGAGEWDQVPPGSIHSAGDQSRLGAQLDGGDGPLPIRGQGTLSQLRALELLDASFRKRVAPD